MTKLPLPEGIARKAVAAGLSLSFAIAGALGAIAPATTALAVTEQGTITITAQSGNTVTYDGRQIFKADMLESGKAQHVEWSSNAAKAAVEGAIRAHAGTWTAEDEAADATHVEGTSKYAGTTAQDALEYLNANWGASSATRIVDADDLPNKVAQAVASLPVAGVVTPGTAATFDEGFYLFTTTPSTLSGDNEMGTSPIFTAINADQAVAVTEKTTLPSVAKQVQEDATSAWSNHADAERGQDINYKLTGTVASNVATFDTYFYEFEDTLSAGLTTKTSDVAVTVDGKDVTSQADISFAGGKLKVTFEDLKSLTQVVDEETVAIPITAATQVVVTYKAQLNASAAIGSAGNPNEVFINYSNNPNTTSKGKTNTVDAKAYTYQLEMVKVDKNDATKTLQGAKVTIQVASTNSDEASRGKYVQADGTLGATAYEFTTNDSGKINVAGLDEGTYTIHETQAPTGYDTWNADITLTITSTFNATTGAFETIAATMSGGEGDTNTKVVSTDAETGKVSIQATDDKELDTPLTGASGIAIFTGAGAGIIGLSLAGLWKSRKAEDAEE